jgi:hypothetical protein
MGKNRDSTKTDFSSFMCIILMLTGCLVTIMVANIMIISANPDNITITSVIGLSDFSDGNVTKDANYIDVYRDRLDLYFDQGNRMESVAISDLEAKGNKLDEFIDMVYAVKDTQYIVMLVRPDSADIYRRLRNAIRARKIDLGMELFENDQTVFFKDGMVAEKTGR